MRPLHSQGQRTSGGLQEQGLGSAGGRGPLLPEALPPLAWREPGETKRTDPGTGYSNGDANGKQWGTMGMRIGSDGERGSRSLQPQSESTLLQRPPLRQTQMPCTALAAAWTGSRASPAWRWPPGPSLRVRRRLSEGAAGPKRVAWVWAWRARRATRTGDPRGARSGC